MPRQSGFEEKMNRPTLLHFRQGNSNGDYLKVRILASELVRRMVNHRDTLDWGAALLLRLFWEPVYKRRRAASSYHHIQANAEFFACFSLLLYHCRATALVKTPLVNDRCSDSLMLRANSIRKARPTALSATTSFKHRKFGEHERTRINATNAYQRVPEQRENRALGRVRRPVGKCGKMAARNLLVQADAR
jgi:hypothetical protein